MHLRLIEAENFRNLEKLSIQPQAGINFIYGSNGSGKTNLLEAIHFLGRARSFRSAQNSQLIKHGEPQFTLFAELVKTSHQTIKIGAQRNSSQHQFKVAGQMVRRSSELSTIIPLQVIEPGLHYLLDAGPEHRRRFLEWGVFHVEHDYGAVSSRYRQALNQRNAAIKVRLPAAQIRQWDRALLEYAVRLDSLRHNYLQQLMSFVTQLPYFSELSQSCSFEYYPGWSKEKELAQCLTEQLDSDRQRGFTQSGPHRADIRIKVGADKARDVLSRGQQKLLIAILMLSQCQLIGQHIGSGPIILIDDLVAELDVENQCRFMEFVQATQCQALITATQRKELERTGKGMSYAMFHVEHGQVRRTV
jgi:DNA replication and repair protein RecF